MKTITIDGEHLTLEDVAAVAEQDDITIEISAQAQDRVVRARQAVEELIARGQVVYGVTTGFGHLKNKLISPDQVATLQRNLVMSHAVGVGEPLSEDVVRAMMLIRANTLAKGYSGVRLETLKTLVGMLNRGVHPLVPSKGSLGASGDLAPLAHMSLVLIGQGEAIYQGERLPGGEAMWRAGLEPVELAAKEGLALINGTALMAAIGSLVTYQAENLSHVADIAGALSLEALEGSNEPFDPRLHAVRPHPRQVDCAAYMRRLLTGSEFLRPKSDLTRSLASPEAEANVEPVSGQRARHQRVQDAYSLRCIPQVHGAVRDAVAYARWALEIELNSATDNPLIFWEDEGPVALSGGNFHGELIALAMDYLAMGLTELGNISERRLNRLIDETINDGLLPAFLIKHGGLNSGFMLAQYTAAALTSENKVLAHPASVDTIPTSANTEDHVSMGVTAARHAEEVRRNVEIILAIELFAAAQAIDFRRERAGRPLQMGQGTAPAYELIREHVPFLEHDAVMYPYIEAVRGLIERGELVERVERALLP
ncbi:MAG: histidine ammonia-lyase [Anaerolineae bacterium]